MAVAKQIMTDEQRKSVVIEYLKAFDRAGKTWDGGSILDLFADDAQVYFPKWGLAYGKEEIGKMFGDIGSTLKWIRHHFSHFNFIFSGSDLVVCGDERRGASRWALARRRSGARRGPLVRRIRNSRLENSALLHLSRSRLRRKRHGPVPVVEEQVDKTEPDHRLAANNSREDGNELQSLGSAPMGCAAGGGGHVCVDNAISCTRCQRASVEVRGHNGECLSGYCRSHQTRRDGFDTGAAGSSR